MHLLVDLRFYRPENYGLAVYIKELFAELAPLMEQSQAFAKITIIFDSVNKNKDLSFDITWWQLINESSKFNIHFSDCKYYSIQEQTKFKQEIESFKPDLVYFFTFNFPIFYDRPFVYQVLDFNIPETRNNFDPKVQAMLWCVRAGVNKCRKVLFLGDQTKKLAPKYTKWQFTNKSKPSYKPNQVIYGGLGKKFLTQATATLQTEKIIGIRNDLKMMEKLGELKSSLGLKKPYFTFVSVWRKYKNLSRLIQVFADFNSKHDYKYQLLVCGSMDPKYPEEKKAILKNSEYKEGRIVVAENLPTEDIITLHDGSLAHIFPSLSEGLGFASLEAGSRGVPVLASNIYIFQKILKSGAMFFDPQNSTEMVNVLSQFVNLSDSDRLEMAKESFLNSQKFRWINVAKEILEVLESEIKK